MPCLCPAILLKAAVARCANISDDLATSAKASIAPLPTKISMLSSSSVICANVVTANSRVRGATDVVKSIISSIAPSSANILPALANPEANLCNVAMQSSSTLVPLEIFIISMIAPMCFLV